MSEIRAQFGYTPTWLPGTIVSLGAVGEVSSGGAFQVESSLVSRGLRMVTTRSRGAMDLTYTSRSGVAITFKSAGSAPPVGSFLSAAEAGCAVEFGRSGAIVLAAQHCVTTRLANLEQISREVLDWYRGGVWAEELRVVAEVVVARSLTVVISRMAGARVDLAASGKLGPVAVELASIDVGLTVRHESSLEFRAIAEPGATVMYRVAGIVRPHVMGARAFRMTALASAIEPAGEIEQDYADFSLLA